MFMLFVPLSSVIDYLYYSTHIIIMEHNATAN